MRTRTGPWQDELATDGFTVLRDVLSSAQVDACLAGLMAALQRQPEAVRSASGSVYAARNILTLWPDAATVWRQLPLLDMLSAVLGPRGGLVRTLFFDKPPDSTWALPWHKDATIAVRDNRRPSACFSHPTRKAGVPHVEAPTEVLGGMVTARIHLDDVTEENGPLRVIPESHRTGKDMVLGDAAPVSVLARRGDVLLMRPLLAHCSNRSAPETRRHRRILHLEFAANPELPDGYEWHDFRPIR